MIEEEERRHDSITRERIAVLETQMQTVIRSHEHMLAMLADIQQTLAAAKGGWQVMLWVGGGSAAFAGLVVEAIHKFGK